MRYSTVRQTNNQYLMQKPQMFHRSRPTSKRSVTLVNLMTKIHSKYYTALVGTVLIASMLAPLAAAEQTTSTDLPRTSSGQATSAEKGFCARLGGLSGQIDQNITGRLSKLGDKRSETEKNLESRVTDRDKQLADNRANWDENRNRQYAGLEAQANPDTQKQAVAEFKLTVEAAITTRKAAIDAAIQAFRTGVKNDLDARKSSVDAAIKTFTDAGKAAFEKARTDCASDVAPATVRATLQASLKAAKEKLASDIKIIEKKKDATKPLIEARKTAIEKAIQDFKNAMEAARTALKAAWGGTATTTPASTR